MPDNARVCVYRRSGRVLSEVNLVQGHGPFVRCLHKMNSQFVSGIDYRGLVAQHGSPLLILDQAAVRHQYRSLVAALPGVTLHYALKPLPHMGVIEVLKSEGACFDLATNGEVDLMREAQINPNECIHTHPIKRDSDIRYALDYGWSLALGLNKINKLKKIKKIKKIWFAINAVRI